MEPGSSVGTIVTQSQDRWQWTQTETQEALSEYWGILFHCERKMMESSSLDIFKSCPDRVIGNWLYLAVLEQRGWARWVLEVTSNLRSDADQMKIIRMRFFFFSKIPRSPGPTKYLLECWNKVLIQIKLISVIHATRYISI